VLAKSSFVVLLPSAVVLTGCGESKLPQATAKYQMSIAPSGQVYRLNVTSGEVALIEKVPAISEGRTKLVVGSFYETEQGKVLRYSGNGKFELMPSLDEIFKK
jgi:hypothetical protein